MVKICRFRPPKQENYGHYRARILSVPLGSFAQPRRSQLKSHVGQLYKQKGFEKPCAETMGRLPTKICSTLCAYSPSSWGKPSSKQAWGTWIPMAVKWPLEPAPGIPLMERRWVSTDLCDIKMEVSWNRGTPKSSILIYFDGIFHYKPSIIGVAPFWEPPKIRVETFGTLKMSRIHKDKENLRFGSALAGWDCWDGNLEWSS